MRFSGVYGIDRGDADDWFDPILSADTNLFVDPFLIYRDEDRSWRDGHRELVAFFEEVLTLVAKAGNTKSNHWQAAERLLLFPEPPEFCIGTGVRPLGRGTGETHRAGMLEGARTTAELVGTDVEHIEELSLFQEGIGADLISDIVCNILKHRFIDYTREIASRHDVPLKDVPVRHARWDPNYLGWVDEPVSLPINPFTGTGVLLTPARFLKKYPTVDPEDFWDWAWVNRNEEIRGQFEYAIARQVDAERIAQFARRNPHLAADYLKSMEDTAPRPYDVERDPDGEVSWYDAGANLALAVGPGTGGPPDDPDEFCAFVRSLCEAFADFVRTHREGWENLWIGDKPRKERHVQAAFRTFLYLICREKDVDLSAEPNTGRGPVDFKITKGAWRKALIEVKRLASSDYWHGLMTQTPVYMEAEDALCGYYLSVGWYDSDLAPERQRLVRKAATELSKRLKVPIAAVFVDARQKPSASKA